ncbi:MAG: hypothetical protein HY735_25065 [Verrucomicrobia bacterium]|nr:hypothetical protein [Verrucomicrobiota bacterium]
MKRKPDSLVSLCLSMGLLAAVGHAQEKAQYFEKGTLRLTATDNDGWAYLRTSVYRWNDEKRDWGHVEDRSTDNGKCNYSLSPGVYKLAMYYQEAEPHEGRTIEGIQIADKAVVDKAEYFEKGALRLTATDHDGWAYLRTSVYRWNDEKRDWGHVEGQSTDNGKCNYSLSPGVYKLAMSYQEAEPHEGRTIEGIQVFDRETLSIGEMFGGGNLPPIIAASGPFEIGDGDGYYEVGERVLFRLDIRDTDFDKADFLLNDRILRTTDQPGKYEQILVLSVPGDYRFAVRARDKNGTLESYGQTIPVSTQKDRMAQRSKHLPLDYGERRQVMKCPKCAREFAGNTAYCPHDGTQLTFVERVVQGVLDASLSRTGIDPKTPEANHAKKLGIDWLNPFASREQIDKDIQRVVDDVIKK